MMGLLGAIRSLIVGDATVANLVGTRVRPLYGAQLDTLPFITISISNNGGNVTHSGAMGSRYATVEIGIISDTYANAETLAAAIVSTIHGFRGTAGGVRIWPAKFDEESDIEQAVQPGANKPVYLKTVQFTTRYQ